MDTGETTVEIDQERVKEILARFKLPERLEIWSSLPSNPSGKIQKFLIRNALLETTSKGRP